MENDNSTEEFIVDFGEVIDTGGGGTSDFNELSNRPMYNDSLMTGSTNIPKVPTKTSELTNDQNYQTGAEVQSAVSSATSGKQDKLTAGDNISISNNVISATDTTYTAGNGLDLTGTTFSVDTTEVATKSDLGGKQNTLTAGTNITISDDTISATDTTYLAFTGTDGQTAGTSGLVPAPATTDADKFLKSDGTWDVAGGSSINVVQTTGTSTTDVMSQDATTKLVFDTNNTNYENIKIGEGPYTSGLHSVGIGKYAAPTGINSIAIGSSGSANNRTKSSSEGSTAIGFHSSANGEYSIALGSFSSASRKGEINVEAGITHGYDNSGYRLLRGLYDGQEAHDAVTVEQVNATIDAINAALSTSIPHIGASN